MNYLLQASTCLIAFYLIYFLFLKRDKFFRLQRTYLVAAIILSIAIPLIDFSPQAAREVAILENFEVPNVDFTQSAEANESTWGINEYLWVFYIGGILLMTARFAKNLARLLVIIRKGEKEKLDQYILVKTQESIPFASFYKYIFVANSPDLKEDDMSYLLLHEQKHIQDRHSLDILLIALSKVFFWFNPVIWLYERDLKSVHEFICDEEVVKQTSKASYEKLLIKSLFEKVGLPLASSFNDISIKNRIIMMNKQNSIWIKQLKVLISLPVVFLLLLACNPDGLPATTPIEVSGVVTNAEGKGMPGVNVVVDGTQTGTITNLEGQYKLANLTEDQSLTFSFVGFNSISVPVGTRSTIDVELEQGDEPLPSAPAQASNSETIDVKFEIETNTSETFSGKLMDVDGNPLGNYAVVVLGDNKQRATTKTDENGNFELTTNRKTERFVVYDGVKNVKVLSVE